MEKGTRIRIAQVPEALDIMFSALQEKSVPERTIEDGK
jgi:hypothetical protein